MNGLGIEKLTAWLARRPHWLLAGHVLILHILAFGGWKTIEGRLLWLVAVGLLLMWQPFVEGERRIERQQVVVLLGVVFALAVGLNPWLLLIWTGALAAIIGGRVFWTVGRLERIGYLHAFGYLVSLAVLGLVPEIAPAAVALDPLPREAIGRYMPLLLPPLLLFPASQPQRKAGDAFDFIYSVLVFLLLAVFLLGTLAYMLVGQISYPEAVFKTSLAIAGALLLLAWSWNPRAGFSGIGSAFSRYLLSVGMPLEQWLVVLNEESEREKDPERFLDRVVFRLMRLPWVDGGRWRVGGKDGQCGVVSPYGFGFERDDISLHLYFRHQLSPAMCWHVEWLLRLAVEFFLVKRQARELQRINYLQAVYQTGARVTHDVKNLLQSLQVLCYAAAQPGEPEAVALLLGRQLPQLTERLKSTLDKLQRPQAEGDDMVEAERWWLALRERYATAGIRWKDGGLPLVGALPKGLYDSVAENLLQNALAKRQREAGLVIDAELSSSGELRVTDNGTPLPAGLANRLFAEPLPSEDGFGIGLFHAARHAEERGFRLRLENNELGRVTFSLASQ